MYMGSLLQDEQYMYVMSQTYTYTHREHQKGRFVFRKCVFVPRKYDGFMKLEYSLELQTNIHISGSQNLINNLTNQILLGYKLTQPKSQYWAMDEQYCL